MGEWLAAYTRMLARKDDIMIEDIIVEPMTKELILWRCLHGGPLSCETIDRWPSNSELLWERYRNRNVPLLAKLTRIYGACAIVARACDQIVGLLRFYPKAVWDMAGAGGLCLQQDHPSGPADDFAGKDFPTLAQIEDKMLVVHCLMTGCARQKEHPYQRKGLGTRMVRTLIEWAKASGWDRIEASAFEDIPIIYEITGSAGHTFWEKLGFSIVDRRPHPDLQEPCEFVTTLEEQAKSLGIPSERARDQLVMRLNLTS
jgi:GNAT superfamily N-acetyltransferase